MQKAKLLWLDLETTGLDPANDRILEVAVVATNFDLDIIDEKQFTIHVPESVIERRMIGEFWNNNAQSKANIVKNNKNGHASEYVEHLLMSFIKKNFGDNIILAGNSIHFDRSFIKVEWPLFEKRLYYRMLDVSAWKVMFENRLGKKFEKKLCHRAMDDIHESIDELKYYLQYIKA